jgi:geranylgeranylglycerol-phosphate geranylgeranyltransferase
MTKTIYYLIQLSRPSNIFITFCTIFVAASITGTIQPVKNVILAALSASLIAVGANTINDYYDIEIDRINKPHRILAANKLSLEVALIYFILVYLFAWVISLAINFKMFLIAFTIGILLYLYSFRLKRTIIWGNVTVSFATSMAFIYGGLAVNRFSETLFPASFAFLFHFGREIIKDMQDVKGDHGKGAITFAVKYGTSASLRLTLITFIVLIFLTIIPYVLKIYNIIYMIIVIIGIYPVLIYVLYVSWKKPEVKNLGKMSNILKIDMIIGLLAIYLG